MVPWLHDVSVRIPVDVGRDPHGSLVVVGGRNGFAVRLRGHDEEPAAPLRRRAHWDVCPHQRVWHEVMTAIGLRQSVADRSGTCAICRRRHPWHYGGPVASPVCDRCRAERGLSTIGEIRTQVVHFPAEQMNQ